MTRTTRHLLVSMMMTVLAGAGRPAVAADLDAPEMPRVRSSNAAIAALIGQATERSETFRAIVATINASDGIVYVEEGTCGHGVRACFVAVAKVGVTRLLRVKVATDKADWDLMGSIGHELRHTIEVLGNPKVVDNSSMFFFYDRIGKRSSPSPFETADATNAGNAVRDEVRKSRSRAEGN